MLLHLGPLLHLEPVVTFVPSTRSTLVSLGHPDKDYAGHSFRRGYACYGFQAGIPIELIKILGDWKSDAVLLYLTVPLSIRLESINEITKSLLPNNSNIYTLTMLYTLALGKCMIVN